MSGTALPAAEAAAPTTVPADLDLDGDGGTAPTDPDLPVAPVADDPPDTDDPSGNADDHSDTVGGASPVVVGEAAAGSVDYEFDVDYFVFEAEGGVTHRIEVSLGTLPDSVLALYDADGWELAYSDDYLGLKSRIDWIGESGTFYVAVSGYEDATGSYTLTVDRIVPDPPDIDDPSDIVDDHSDTVDGATPVAVGEEAAGSVDYEFDVDYFVFEAEAGGLYRIDVSLGTLSDSVAVLYDADEWDLAYNDDYLDRESRIYWQAESSGDFYVAVRGYEDKTGSYTLTIAPVVDDHADTADGATPVAVAESVPGSVDYAYDVDYFALEAQAGELYQIDVKLGTLSDSVAALYDAEGWELAFNDDRDGSDDHEEMDLSSRFDWQAESSGTFYIAVMGYEAVTGSYTLTVDGFASTASLS